MVGTLINVALILAGCLIGLLFGRFINERLKDVVMQGLALCVILIGAQGALGISGTAVAPVDTLCVIVSMVVGGIIGTALDIEGHVDALGRFAERKLSGGRDNRISKAFFTTSLLYCVGAMAIVGAINSSLRGDHATLIAKGVIDGVTAIFFTGTMGWGTVLSAGAVLVYQGAIALLAQLIGPLLSEAIITQMSAVGGLLIIGVGLNMIRDKHIPVGNLIPAMFIPMAYLPLAALLGAG